MSSTRDLMEEVRDIIAESHRPLSTREIAARSGLADGVASLATPLRRLRDAGDVIAIDRGGPRLYRLADGAADPSAGSRDDDAGVSAEPPSAPPQGVGLRDLVRSAAAELEGEFTAQDVASRTGLDVHKASKTLSALAQLGELARRDLGGKRYAYFRPRLAAAGGQQAPAPKPAPTATGPAKPKAPARPTSSYPSPHSTDPARYAYRSDGTLLIEPHAGGPVELDREETERLYIYLTAIHRGVRAALGEEA